MSSTARSGAHPAGRYLETHTATPSMRRVEFPLRDRPVLTPVEFVHTALPMVVVAAALWFLAGPVAALAVVSAVLAGTVLFPAPLQYPPTQDFSTKGLILGILVAIPFAAAFGTAPFLPAWAEVAGAAAALLLMGGEDWSWLQLLSRVEYGTPLFEIFARYLSVKEFDAKALISNWDNQDDFGKWLIWLWLKLEAKTPYMCRVIRNCNNYHMIISSLTNEIFDCSPYNAEYEILYTERKDYLLVLK